MGSDIGMLQERECGEGFTATYNSSVFPGHARWKSRDTRSVVIIVFGDIFVMIPLTFQNDDL